MKLQKIYTALLVTDLPRAEDWYASLDSHVREKT
jgi:hypothetical protein